jgi:hypothetical protein
MLTTGWQCTDRTTGTSCRLHSRAMVGKSKQQRHIIKLWQTTKHTDASPAVVDVLVAAPVPLYTTMINFIIHTFENVLLSKTMLEYDKRITQHQQKHLFKKRHTVVVGCE